MPSRITVPNLLTAARIVMSAVAVGLAVTGRHQAAVLILIIAALLDAFDGWYARTFSQRSALGAHLDPIADKILMGVVYAWIGVEAGSAVIWALIALVAFREVTVTLLRSVSLRRRRRFIPASRLGRIKMLAQSMVGLTVLSVMHFFDRAVPGPVLVTALAPIVVISYASAVGYVAGWRRAEASPRAKIVVVGDSAPERRASAGR